MLSVSYFSHFQNRKRGPVPRLYKILRKYHVIIASHTSLRSPAPNLPQLLEFVTTMSNQCSQNFFFFFFRISCRFSQKSILSLHWNHANFQQWHMERPLRCELGCRGEKFSLPSTGIQWTQPGSPFENWNK